MLTTRRNTGSSESGSAIDVLERRNPSMFEETESRESLDAEREKMHRNLNLLLYGDTAEQEVTETAEEVAEDTAPEIQAEARSDDDIRPTSTTMQFGDGDVSNVYNDMERSKEQEKTSYKLNGKGKFVVALYALTVMVILALIVLNTGVLASLKRTNEARVETLNSRIAEYNALTERIDAISADDYVVSVAQNEYGMVKGN